MVVVLVFVVVVDIVLNNFGNSTEYPNPDGLMLQNG
jgi:hypothetical protein